jgi:hypothetical protein
MFKEMFENTAEAEDDRSEVTIDKMNPIVLKKLLEFIYTDKVGKGDKLWITVVGVISA